MVRYRFKQPNNNYAALSLVLTLRTTSRSSIAQGKILYISYEL